jgi:glycosyltransferase involved in cell wall biosynthesis
MVSINAASYPYRHEKLTCVGHGIDTTLFEPAEVAPVGPPLLLSVGRLSPVKDPMTLVMAVAVLRERGHDVRCALVGEAPERDLAFATRLREQVRTMGLDGVVHFTGALRYEAVGHWYRRCFAHVNCAPTDNAVDKAALEAMACAKPSLSSALTFQETMGHLASRLIFRHGDATDLADRLAALLALPPGELAGIGRELRERVVRMHDLESVADKLLAVFAGVMAPDRRSDWT